VFEVRDLIDCRACPRLVHWRESVASAKRAAFADQDYWGRPVPGLGDPDAPLFLVGLAPAAHGANRTGRMFTGDRSGDFLFSSLHRLGMANQPTSIDFDDGLELTGVYITSAVKCAPPANKPTAIEQDTCGRWLAAELDRGPRVIVALGGLAFGRVVRMGAQLGWGPPVQPAKFGHGVRTRFETGPEMFGCYHPSQQNTFTGRLTPDMFDSVLGDALLAAR